MDDTFRELVELNPEGVMVCGGGRILYTNRAARRLLGLAADGVAEDRSPLDFVHPDARARVGARLSAIEEGGGSSPSIQERLTRADGTQVVVEITGVRVSWSGTPAVAAWLREPYPRPAVESNQSEDNFALAVAGSSSGLWEYNYVTNALSVSPRFRQLLGYDDADFPDDVMTIFDLIHAEDRERVTTAIQAHRVGHVARLEFELRIQHKGGHWRWYLVRGLAARLPDGTVYRIAGSIVDIDLYRQGGHTLSSGERLDHLTRLPSRGALLERLGARVTRAREGERGHFAVLFLDVDRFQVVNDSLGHLFGDDVLVELGRRLQRAVRLQDMVARFGGDEFTILLEEIQDPRDAARVADRIHRQLAAPVVARGQDVFVTVSIGIAVDEGRYVSGEELLRDADNAMYRAKSLGRAQHVIFDHAMHLAAVQQLQLETDLHRALEREELVVHYQPIIRLDGGRVAGFEALVRWKHPRRGLMGPLDFIPVAEDSGLIVQLGMWVLQRAMHDLRALQEAHADAPGLWMAVNLSARQFQQDDLVERIGEVLETEGVDARRLKLEVTESTLMADSRAARHMLERLRALGVRICIDDFGTGYSSLSHLRMFPLDMLKMDRTFIAMVDPDRGGDLALARSIVALSHQLGLEAVAEGVEVQGQLDALIGLGCDFAQGFLFARARPLEELGAG